LSRQKSTNFKNELSHTALLVCPVSGDIIHVTLRSEKYNAPAVADIHRGDVNLDVVKWSQVNMLGDEYEARQ
jgi:hypothetical protein